MIYSIPNWIPQAFPKLIWSKPSSAKEIYLTFDDGPTPQVTDFTLKLLDEYNAKGTFFCVGDNVRRFSSIASDALASGHSLGNHTYHHKNGWKTSSAIYAREVALCQQAFETHLSVLPKMFRPPYGRITPKQATEINQTYQIVMWSYLTGDYENDIDLDKRWSHMKTSIQPGKIVVFHDSEKAFFNLRYLLPRTLDYFSSQGFRFLPL